MDPPGRPAWWRRYSFTIAAAVLFVAAWFGQFYFQASAFAEDVQIHGGRPGWGDFWNVFLAATFENWQAEFLQLCWQVAGLTLFYQWRQDRMDRQIAELQAARVALNVAIVRMHAVLDRPDVEQR